MLILPGSLNAKSNKKHRLTPLEFALKLKKGRDATLKSLYLDFLLRSKAGGDKGKLSKVINLNDKYLTYYETIYLALSKKESYFKKALNKNFSALQQSVEGVLAENYFLKERRSRTAPDLKISFGFCQSLQNEILREGCTANWIAKSCLSNQFYFSALEPVLRKNKKLGQYIYLYCKKEKH